MLQFFLGILVEYQPEYVTSLAEDVREDSTPAAGHVYGAATMYFVIGLISVASIRINLCEYSKTGAVWFYHLIRMQVMASEGDGSQRRVESDDFSRTGLLAAEMTTASARRSYSRELEGPLLSLTDDSAIL